MQLVLLMSAEHARLLQQVLSVLTNVNFTWSASRETGAVYTDWLQN
jgi:uncharacterized lipoprotein